MSEHDEVDAFLRRTARAHDAVEPVSATEASSRPAPKGRWASPVRTDRRAPVLAAAVVLALVAGCVVGFAAGRSSAPKVRATVATRDGSTQVAPAPASSVVGSSAAADSFAGNGVSQSLTSLFRRTTADGVTIRTFSGGAVYAVPAIAVPTCPPGADCAAVGGSGGVNQSTCAGSQPASSVVLEVSTDEAVSQGGAAVYDLGGQPGVVRSQMGFGGPEGAPAQVSAVQVDPAATDVRATWPDGFVDHMAPADGWAVLAHKSGDVPSITVTAGDGSTHPVATFSAGPPQPCQSPAPALPPVGAEQPDDPAGAKADITTAYQTVFTHDTDKTERGKYVEDAEALQPIGDQATSNFPEAASTITVDIGDIVFTSPTEAALQFTLNYTGGAEFGQQIGYARLIDGTWKIGRETMCMVYGWAGATCPGSPNGSTRTTTAN